MFETNEQGRLLRIYVDEKQTHNGVLLWEWLLEQASKLGMQGGSAFRAIGSFGRHHELRESRFFELAGGRGDGATAGTCSRGRDSGILCAYASGFRHHQSGCRGCKKRIAQRIAERTIGAVRGKCCFFTFIRCNFANALANHRVFRCIVALLSVSHSYFLTSRMEYKHGQGRKSCIPQESRTR